MKTINLRLLVDDDADPAELMERLLDVSEEDRVPTVYGAVELVDPGFREHHNELVPRGRWTGEPSEGRTWRADVVVRPGFEPWDGE